MMSSKKIYSCAFFVLVVLKDMSVCLAQSSSTVSSVMISSCPQDCQCVVLKGSRNLNHAKCSSVRGFLPETYDHVKNIETGSISFLPLHSIDFSHIGLLKLSHHLEKLRDVTSINLSYNNLTEVSHFGRRVRKLNLQHNRITSSKLTKLPPHVQHLDLSYNDLTYLPLELTRLTNLQSVELSHNKINCSCETLDVRNWLQQKHIFTENPVKCTYPNDLKGKSWLQIKQSEICDREKNKWLVNTQENELMLGDQPTSDSSGEQANDGGEIGKDFIPFISNALQLKQTIITKTGLDLGIEDEVDGSGSGMSPIMITKVSISNENKKKKDEKDSSSLEDIFGNGLGIVQFHDTDDNKNDVIKEETVPVIFDDPKTNSGASTTVTVSAIDSFSGKEIEKASISSDEGKSESEGTYYLLGVIVLVVVGLVLFVGVKRCKARNQRINNEGDTSQSTELVNMDRGHPGKPIYKNGTENFPLISKKQDGDATLITDINDSKYLIHNGNDIKDGPNRQPLLNGDELSYSTKICNESNNNVISSGVQPMMNETMQVSEQYDPNYRIIPRYPPPKSPRDSRYSQIAEERKYSASLQSPPLSGRYSPVYSPETGRVKIKLTETPKPKTPILITRCMSSSGNLVTTLINAESINEVLNIPEIQHTKVGVSQSQ